MKRAIRKYARDFIAVIVLRGRSRRGVGGYILSNQRLRFPVIQDEADQAQRRVHDRAGRDAGSGPDRPRLRREGSATSRKVELKNGRAIVDDGRSTREYEDSSTSDATALLRPKTGLKDMFIELDPGSNDAPRGARTASRSRSRTRCPTSTPTRSSPRSTPTRATTSSCWSAAPARASRAAAHDLQEVFRRFEPTHRDLAADQRVHADAPPEPAAAHQLAEPAQQGSWPSKGDELAQLVDSSSSVFRAFASEQQNISRAVARPARPLRQTTRRRWARSTPSRACSRPTVENLRPAVRSLDTRQPGDHPVRQGGGAAPAARHPPVRARRAAARARPAPGGAATWPRPTPDLTRSFTVLNHLFNMLGFNPNGREGPDKSPTARRATCSGSPG